ncbi:MAG TPA: HAD-IC family P-type ATPase, partial [Symbiobacteriaceae bacterium]|nr:HAD-IC family P-type ATPase [Symbiobacteriaceae bacterium]
MNITHHWHADSPDSALAATNSGPQGLAAAAATERLAQDGPNEIPKGREETTLQIIWRQINNPLIWVLLGAGALSVAIGKGTDGLTVFAVVILNAVIGYVQESRAGKAIAALASLVPQNATVLRDGQETAIPAREIVRGDLVVLRSGDKVPADLRLVSLKSLQIEESALTGESLPVSKTTDPVDAGAPLGDRTCLAFGGTLVTWGTGTGVVVATGAETELGRIQLMMNEAGTKVETPLTRQIEQLSKMLTIVIGVVALLLLIAGLVRGYAIGDAILAAVTLAVAAIPEGLPAVITIALAIGVQRMADRKAVVRILPAVETLGSVNTICSDKTGTLTKNEMTVQAIWLPAESWRVTGVGYEPKGGFVREGSGAAPVDAAGLAPTDAPPSAAALELLKAAVLCSDSTLEQAGGEWRVTGDPTEGALVVALQKAGITAAELRAANPRKDAIPFESERQYMATLNQRADGTCQFLVKGGAEVVFQRCTEMAGGRPFDAEAAHEAMRGYAGQGMRVLAIAEKPNVCSDNTVEEEELHQGLRLLGLVAMIDPPRAEAIEAVAAFKRAGIVTKMITGDHAVTAAAIGQQLGLTEGAPLTDGRPGGIGANASAAAAPIAPATTGSELEAMDDAQLRTVALRQNVFARVAPEQKLRLVKALQTEGQVVAMTGDGVNDGPALRQADIGVAMGITGTEVAKEAGAIILTDDNFATIRSAVEEGRRVYDNLIKSFAFLLPTNLGEGLIILIAVLFFPFVGGTILMPIEPTQVLWINLVSTITLSLPLALEAKEPDVMERPPRPKQDPGTARFLAVRTLLVALFFTAQALVVFLSIIGRHGGSVSHGALAQAQTGAVTAVVLAQIFYVIQCRSISGFVTEIGFRSNLFIWYGIGLLLLLQVGFVYLPFLQVAFGTAPLAGGDWLLVLGSAV